MTVPSAAPGDIWHVPGSRSRRRRRSPPGMVLLKTFLMGLIMLTCYSTAGWADHCPEDRRAAGEAETTLAGISFERGRFPGALSLYGRADSKDEHTDATYPEGSGEVRYSWNLDGGQLEVFTLFYHRNNLKIESAVSVRIEGDTGGPEWQTGRGLRPGDSFDKVVKLYGSVFLEGIVSGSQPPGQKATLCFSNETLLSIDIDEMRRVSAIRLAPSIE